MTQRRHQISEAESSRIQRFLYIVAGGTAAFAVLVLTAFLTADRWLLLISHEGERRFADRYVMAVKNRLLTPGDATLQRYVEDLTHQIAAHMNASDDLEIRVHVVKGPANAAAAPGGHIFVLEGLLRTLDSENSLAMVLAHELAHCINRDPLRGAGRGLLLDIALSSATGGAVAGNQLILKSYSREWERAADQDALRALQSRYGHVGGATRLFEILRGGKDHSIPQAIHQETQLLSTHPALDERIRAIENRARDEGWRTGPTLPYPEEVRAALASAKP